MSDDVRLLLGRLDEPVTVRPAFADSLRAILHDELGFTPVSSGVGTASASPMVSLAAGGIDSYRPTLLERLAGALRPMTPRAALLVLAALLLIACTVAGALIVASTWVSSAPRGPQYTNDFTFTDAYREPGTTLSWLQAGPDGQSMFAVAETWNGVRRTDPVVVRLDVDPADGTLTRHEVLRLASLANPSLWPAGTDLGSGDVAPGPANPGSSALTVAPNGDLFLGIRLQTANERAATPNTVVAVHADGSSQRVVSLDELESMGLIDQKIHGGWVTVAASAPDHLWAKAEGWRTQGRVTDGLAWLFEIVDPTADGDWADKVIRPISLPADVPAVEPGVYDWQYTGFVAEPSTGSHDRSDSALLSLLGKREYRVYRLTDVTGSGDLSAPATVELVYAGPSDTNDGAAWAPLLAPRVVGDGEPVIDELIAAGLTRSGRVSRIAGSVVTDILRALPGALGVAATRDGSIYVAGYDQDPGGNPSAGAGVISRLAPVPVGSSAPANAQVATTSPGATPLAAGGGTAPGTTEAAGSPGASPAASVASLLPPRVPLTDGEPRIAVWFAGTAPSGDWLNELVFIGADGSGPADILSGTLRQGLYPSTDGTRIAFWSDEEVPNESYLYTDAVGGGDRTLVSESAGMLTCPFPPEGVLAFATSGSPWRATWHPTSGEPVEVALEIPVDGVLGATPDGTWVAVASGPDGRTLAAINVRTGEVTTVAQLGDRVRRGTWSPDGARIAIATGPYDPLDPEKTATFDVGVVDRDGGTTRHLLTVTGHGPDLTWSPDGSSIAVNARNGATTGYATAGDLVVVDVTTGATRGVAADVVFAGWSPTDPATFAYAALPTLFIETAGKPTREITGPTGKLCPACDERPTARWPYFGLGWSPDGRYIGTGESVVGVIDVATGEYRVLLTDTDDALVNSARWWPGP